jgi:indole-3-glycerol phosphate synthase
MNILDEIIRNKREELKQITKETAISDLEKSSLFGRETISLSASLLDKNKTGIIAEFKRKSPSKGVINCSSSVEEVTSGYFREGASGVSVLTDNKFFGGSAADLIQAREKSAFPYTEEGFYY